MKGALFFYSKYGSTKQYAQWIAAETGLPLFDVQDAESYPANYDFLVVGSPILYYKLAIGKWIKKHFAAIKDTPIIFFSVSGAAKGKRLDKWIGDSLPSHMISRMHHVALRGRQIPEQLTLYDRMMLLIGALFNRDAQAKKEELKGFDYMDRSSIAPIVDLVQQFQSKTLPGKSTAYLGNRYG